MSKSMSNIPLVVHMISDKIGCQISYAFYSQFSNESGKKSIQVVFDQTRLDDIFTLFLFVNEA